MNNDGQMFYQIDDRTADAITILGEGVSPADFHANNAPLLLVNLSGEEGCDRWIEGDARTQTVKADIGSLACETVEHAKSNRIMFMFNVEWYNFLHTCKFV